MYIYRHENGDGHTCTCRIVNGYWRTFSKAFSCFWAPTVSAKVAAAQPQWLRQRLRRTLSVRFSGCGTHSMYVSVAAAHTQYDIKSPEIVCNNFGAYWVCGEATEGGTECTLERLWRTLGIRSRGFGAFSVGLKVNFSKKFTLKQLRGT